MSGEREENVMINKPDQQGEWRVVTSLGLPAVVAPGGIKYHLESISDVHDLMARITALKTENTRLREALGNVIETMDSALSCWVQDMADTMLVDGMKEARDALSSTGGEAL